MKPILALAALLCLAAHPALGADAPAAGAAVATLAHGIFDHVPVYRPAGRMSGFVLLMSGSGGWDAAAQDSARALAAQGNMVAGIDTSGLLARMDGGNGACTFPDGDMENLSRFVQAYEKVPGYFPPVLVGRQTGAAVSYALHAQGSPARFAGLVTVDFCPVLPIRKPLCQGEGTRFSRRKDGTLDLLPAGTPAHPWIAIQTASAPACPSAPGFMSRMPAAQVRKAAGAEAEAPEVAAAVASLNAQRPAQAAPPPATVADLPIIEIPASPTAPVQRDTFAILLSGDGGWAGLDKDVAASLSKDGVPVVGLDSLRYFWTARTPESVTADLDRLIRFYVQRWNKSRVLLVGYSQGADVLPFVINRLPADSARHVAVVGLLGLGRKAAFEFQVANWLTSPHNGLPIQPEADKMPPGLALCIYGADEEKDSTCPGLDQARARSVRLAGGHHFDGDYDKLARLILDAAHSPASANR